MLSKKAILITSMLLGIILAAVFLTYCHAKLPKKIKAVPKLQMRLQIENIKDDIYLAQVLIINKSGEACFYKHYTDLGFLAYMEGYINIKKIQGKKEHQLRAHSVVSTTYEATQPVHLYGDEIIGEQSVLLFVKDIKKGDKYIAELENGLTKSKEMCKGYSSRAVWHGKLKSNTVVIK